jgi:hypothetical protein
MRRARTEMEAPNPPLVANHSTSRGSTLPTVSGSRAAATVAAKELVVDEALVPNGKRERLGQHVIMTGAATPVPVAIVSAAPTKRLKKLDNNLQKKTTPKKTGAKKPSAKMVSLTSLMASIDDAFFTLSATRIVVGILHGCTIDSA